MMKTKWRTENEYLDGTGRLYYQCQCPQVFGSSVSPEFLYALCYMPDTNKIWFWDEMRSDSVTTLMTCTSWEQAELVKVMLTSGKSNWMKSVTSSNTDPCDALSALEDEQASVAPGSVKDHVIREVVNELHDIAKEHHNGGQLRVRLRAAIEPLIK